MIDVTLRYGKAPVGAYKPTEEEEEEAEEDIYIYIFFFFFPPPPFFPKFEALL